MARVRSDPCREQIDDGAGDSIAAGCEGFAAIIASPGKSDRDDILQTGGLQREDGSTKKKKKASAKASLDPGLAATVCTREAWSPGFQPIKTLQSQ